MGRVRDRSAKGCADARRRRLGELHADCADRSPRRRCAVGDAARPRAASSLLTPGNRADRTERVAVARTRACSETPVDAELARAPSFWRASPAANVPPGADEGGPGTLADGSGTGLEHAGIEGDLAASCITRGACRRIRSAARALPTVVSDDNARRQLPGRRSRTHCQQRPGPHRSAKRVSPGRVAALAALAGRARWSVRALGCTRSRTDFSSTSSQTFPSRHENYLSPKAALSWQLQDDTILKASLGRAVRVPTVAELYGATSTVSSQFINDPYLNPERS